jgi:hypothetical protein
VIAFTDPELNIILTVLVRCDPMSIIADVQGVIKKIQAYAQEQQQTQMAEAVSEAE